VTASGDDKARAARLTADVVASNARIAELVQEVEELTAAREHAAVIEQAKGVIMHTMGCGPDAAFAALIVQSQLENRKLRDIAMELAGIQEQ